MKLDNFLSNYLTFPKPGNKNTAELKLKQWLDLPSAVSDRKLNEFIAGSIQNKKLLSLLQSVFGNSPFLTQAIMKNKKFFSDICTNGFDNEFDKLIASVKNTDFIEISKSDLTKEVRHLKLKCSLLVALADITNHWSLEKVTNRLSDFAEAIVNLCINFILTEAGKNKQVKIQNPSNPSEGSGLVILAVGKLGSRELNYSSDIDLIILYDDIKKFHVGKSSVSQFFVNLAHDLSALLQNRTIDGYVFRTDLRLRPDPGATPPAISIASAKHYYETVGQNWERAAMIKARPIAGDMEAGKKFVQFLGQNYIWRKYLDFASIQDIHSIKRQIDSKVGKLPKNLEGYNVKLGHGGIREIEFFVQTQQLIWGGKQKELQIAHTCEALIALEKAGKIDKKTKNEMISAYEFYRQVEHRLQMIDDQQTHSLPENEEKLKELAIFLNFKNTKEFVDKLKETIFTVKGHYSHLFEQSPSLASEIPGITGSLVFTGIENDPETLNTLSRMGFSDPARISEIVRGWHHGRRNATKPKRVREILTELMPVLLKSFADSINPDSAFIKFDEFLTRLPGGVQFFSMCYSNTQILSLIAEIMGGYPFIADNLSRKPELLEYVLSGEFYDTLPDRNRLEKTLALLLKQATSLEEVLNLARVWAHERQFRVGVQLIKGKITCEEANTNLSNIADTVLTGIFDHVKKYFEKQNGKLAEGSYAVIAMGKLGGHELTFGSDIDFVFVYDNVDNGKGKKNKLSPSEYYTRLTHRYIHAINSLTEQGRLYEADTRLRPSGHGGPLVPSLEAFGNYYDKSAWSWELMALNRARVLRANEGVKKKLEKLIKEKLVQKRDKKKLLKNIIDMKDRVEKTHGSINMFNIKYVPGGLVDLEYIVHTLQLLHAHKNPQILASNTHEAIKKLAQRKIIKSHEGKILADATTLFHSVQSVLRLTGNDKPEIANMSEAMGKILAQATGSKNFAELKKNLEKSQKSVQKLFKYYIS